VAAHLLPGGLAAGAACFDDSAHASILPRRPVGGRMGCSIRPAASPLTGVRGEAHGVRGEGQE
jgi:hypothetical protein